MSSMPVAVEEEEGEKHADEKFQEEIPREPSGEATRQVEVMIPGVFVIGDEAGVKPAPAAEPVEVQNGNGEEECTNNSVGNQLSGDLYGEDAKRWQEEERLQVAKAIEQVDVAMKKAAEEEAADGEAKDEVGYGGPNDNLTLFQCVWINAASETRDCIVSFVLDGKDMSKCFVDVCLPTMKMVKVEISEMVLEITAEISADWKQGERGRAAKKTADLVCQAVWKGVKAVA